MDKINIAAFKGRMFCTLVQTEMIMSKISEDKLVVEQANDDSLIKCYISISTAAIKSLREVLKLIKALYDIEDISKEIADAAFVCALEGKLSDGKTLYYEINEILSIQETLNDTVGAIIWKVIIKSIANIL